MIASVPGMIGKHHKVQWISPKHGLGNVGLEICATSTNDDLSRSVDLCGGVSFMDIGVGRDSIPYARKHFGGGIRLEVNWF